MFRERTATALSELMLRRLDDVRLAAMMLDGMEVAERTDVVALGITTEGREDPARALGGEHENATLAAPARRLGRSRPRPHPGDPVRDRRRQGAAAGDPRRLR
jgi:hypothetical protein